MKKYFKIGSLMLMSALFLSITLNANTINNVGRTETLVYENSAEKECLDITPKFMVFTNNYQSIGLSLLTRLLSIQTIMMSGSPNPEDILRENIDLSKFD